ncbi:MAG: indole-3-glycerol phosphate synthase TrpC, partial [Candidatus Omnitrophica bacterium]|nr:indole-3-glycerol phosphate synthase TrpC [Candidatus Omnitrophota bacterium]
MAKDALKEIVAKKKEKILLAKQALPEEELRVKVSGLPETRPFREVIVAEIKKASPSKGVIREDFNPAAIAKVYQDVGVQAISVLTEEDYFQGNISYLNEVKNITSVPVLRKDFILEAYQVYESRYFGADAILLIADLLTRDQLSEFMGLADNLGLDYIVEAHTEKELKKVLNLKVPVIGINNRDLHTLEVDSKTTEKLFILVPKDKTVIVESG